MTSGLKNDQVNARHTVAIEERYAPIANGIRANSRDTATA